MILTTVKTTPDHFDKLILGSRYNGDFLTNRTDGGLCLTVLNKGEPVAIIGGVLWVPGVLYSWALISDSVSQCGLSFYKTIKHMIGFYMKEFNLRRLQIYVRETYREGYRFALSLGFDCEGLMIKFFPNGESAYLMVVTK